MQLNITTDYAIRIILALANRDGEVVSSKDISPMDWFKSM